jgi:ferredoxin
MKTAIYYYTGTGNSLWVARKLAWALGESEPIPVMDRQKAGTIKEAVGLVFPVHAWGLPIHIINFIANLKPLQPEYIFAVAVHGGQVANTLIQLNQLLRQNQLSLSAGFEICMPSNYIPWGGPGPKAEQQRKFEAAKTKISHIVPCIRNQEPGPIEKGPLWQRILFTPIYKMSLPHLAGQDRKFWVDEKCNHCAICSKICSAHNITQQDGKPIWSHKCEQCLACLQWCPQEAIQFGKKTPQYPRYHHPEIQLKDMLINR